MIRKILWLLAIFLFIHVNLAEAQQQGKIPRIGFLQRRVAPNAANPDPLGDAFRKGLQELGYIVGKTILIEQRYGEGRDDGLQGLIDELVQLKVDLLVIPTSQGIHAANRQPRRFPSSW